jgi:hypothetical protein
MQFANVRAIRHQNVQCNLNGMKELATMRGEVHLETVKNYLSRGDLRNANATAIEGKRLCRGPFYLAVQDQLEDLIRAIHLSEAAALQQI